MDHILKKLLESEVFTSETREKVGTAFNEILEEAKAEQEKRIRAELAERYAKDKKSIHAALETFLEQELTEHINEFRNGVEAVNKLKSEYASKIVSVQEQAKKYVANRITSIEKVVEGVLGKELSELHESEKVNRRAYLRAITEARSGAEADRKTFKTKAAAVLENIVNVQIQGALDELREDIHAAREADFGREVFESFYTTFRRLLFDSSKEFKALTSKLEESQQKLTRVKTSAIKQIKEARAHAQKSEVGRKRVEESVARARKMAKLLDGLGGMRRAKMKTLLEASKTADLGKTYKRFLPEILSEGKKTTRKQKLEETVVELKTGGQRSKKELTEDLRSSADDDEIAEIKRLSGLE
jgi:hypothetical protein